MRRVIVDSAFRPVASRSCLGVIASAKGIGDALNRIRESGRKETFAARSVTRRFSIGSSLRRSSFVQHSAFVLRRCNSLLGASEQSKKLRPPGSRVCDRESLQEVWRTDNEAATKIFSRVVWKLAQERKRGKFSTREQMIDFLQDSAASESTPRNDVSAFDQDLVQRMLPPLPFDGGDLGSQNAGDFGSQKEAGHDSMAAVPSSSISATNTGPVGSSSTLTSLFALTSDDVQQQSTLTRISTLTIQEQIESTVRQFPDVGADVHGEQYWGYVFSQHFSKPDFLFPPFAFLKVKDTFYGDYALEAAVENGYIPAVVVEVDSEDPKSDAEAFSASPEIREWYGVRTSRQVPPLTISRIIESKNSGELSAAHRLAENYGVPRVVCKVANGGTCHEVLRRVSLAVNGHCKAILRPETLALVPGGFVNFHSGLLPHVKGARVFVNAILEDLPQGVSAHFMDEEADAGPIICKERLDPGLFVFSDDDRDGPGRRTLVSNFRQLLEQQTKLRKKVILETLEKIREVISTDTAAGDRVNVRDALLRAGRLEVQASACAPCFPPLTAQQVRDAIKKLESGEYRGGSLDQ